jgi:hypothetical protein
VSGDQEAAALEALYGAPLESFVAERKRLAAELKASGDSAGAAAVGKAAKPTLSAWAVNQLVRHERPLMERMAETNARVRDAQVGGTRETFAAATAEQRQSMQALRAAAAEILSAAGHPTSPALLERITRNLRALAGDAEGARGRLTRDLADEGFGFGDLAPALAAAAAAGTAPRPRAAAGRDGGAKPQSRAAEAAARAEAQRQARERAEHTRQVAKLRRDLEAAQERATEAADQATRARRAADKAAEESRRADAAVEQARRALAEAEASQP